MSSRPDSAAVSIPVSRASYAARFLRWQSAPEIELGHPAFGRAEWIAAGVIACIFLALRLWHMTDFCVDGDEIFSIDLARQSWVELTRSAVRDSVHPPLFYYLLKLWTGLWGNSLAAVRSLPVTSATLALVPTFLLCRELRLRAWEILTVLALMAVNPMLFYYSMHVRMYSQLVLVATASIWLFLVALRSGARLLPWLALTAVNVVLVYTQYFGWVVVGLEGLVVLFFYRESLLRAVLSTLAVGASFVPWYLAVSRAIHAKGGLNGNLGWISRPTLIDFKWFLFDLTGYADYAAAGRWVDPILWLFWLAIFLFVARTAMTASRRSSAQAWLMLLFALAPAVIAFSASHIAANSVWGHRHLSFSAVPFLILSVMAMRPHWLSRAVVFALLATTALHSCWLTLHSEGRKLPWDGLTLKIERAEAVSQAASSDSAQPVVLYGIDPTQYPIEFYLDEQKLHRASMFAVPVPSTERSALEQLATQLRVEKIESSNIIRAGHYWLIYATPEWGQGQTPAQLLGTRGCRVGEELSDSDRFHQARAIPVWCPE